MCAVQTDAKALLMLCDNRCIILTTVYTYLQAPRKKKRKRSGKANGSATTKLKANSKIIKENGRKKKKRRRQSEPLGVPSAKSEVRKAGKSDVKAKRKRRAGDGKIVETKVEAKAEWLYSSPKSKYMLATCAPPLS
eukprot:1043124-Amorphochlora_amoeboformis.AAC.1